VTGLVSSRKIVNVAAALAPSIDEVYLEDRSCLVPACCIPARSADPLA